MEVFICFNRVLHQNTITSCQNRRYYLDTAIIQFNTFLDTHTAKSIIDGKDSTYWASAFDPDIPETVEIGKYRLFYENLQI